MNARIITLAGLGGALVAACDPAPPPVAPTVAAATPMSRARTFPPLDDACSTDADCVLFSDQIADSPPHTYACCPGCTDRAANRAWRARFQVACQAQRPPMCPPIGCAMPVLRAVCQAGRCAAVP